MLAVYDEHGNFGYRADFWRGSATLQGGEEPIPRGACYRADVDRTFVSRLERGIRQPTITTLIGLGQALGISAADLVRETEKEYLRQS